MAIYVLYVLFRTDRLVDWQLKNFNPFGFGKSPLYTLGAKIGAAVGLLVLLFMVAIMLFITFNAPHL